MTKQDIQEKRLRRLDKRIRHLTALLRVTAIFGGPAKRQAEKRVRDLMLTEAGRLWDVLHPDGEPEDQARRDPANR